MKCYLLVRNSLQVCKTRKEPIVSAVAETVVAKVVKLWNRASVPVVSYKRVLLPYASKLSDK